MITSELEGLIDEIRAVAAELEAQEHRERVRSAITTLTRRVERAKRGDRSDHEPASSSDRSDL